MDMADETRGHPAAHEVGDRDCFGLAGCRAVDHGAHRRAADRTHDRRGLLDRVDERGLLARQRLDAIDDARLHRGVGDRGEAIDAALAAVVLLAGRERALIGGAMDQDAGAEIGGERAQRAHHVDACGGAGRHRTR